MTRLLAIGWRPSWRLSPPPAGAAGCDPIDPSRCLYPWPNDYFREHGQLALTASMMPTNASGTPIDPETTTGRTASAPAPRS